MLLEDFKAAHGISKLNFFRSTKSKRFVAFHGDISVVTTEDFNPESPTKVIYDNPEGESGKDFILSNKQADVAYSL